MKIDAQNPFTMDELKTMFTPDADVPPCANHQLIIPLYIYNGPLLSYKDFYQFALITYSFLVNVGVDLYEFEQLAEDPATWADCCAYKDALQGGEGDVNGVYYMKIFKMNKDSTNAELIKLQTIRLVAMSLKVCKIDVKDYVDLVRRILLSSDVD